MNIKCFFHKLLFSFFYQQLIRTLTKENLQSTNDYTCKQACYYGYFDVVKYSHKKVKLTKEDFQSNNNEACKWACEYGNINVIEYLHQEIGLTKEDF